MSEEHLIHLKKKGDPYSDGIRAKLKGSASDKRKIAQKIAGLKKAKPKNIEKKVLELIANPKVSAIEIMKMIEILKEKDLENNAQIQLINTAIKAYTALFGNKNYNVNIDLTQEELNKRVYEIIGDVREKSTSTSEESGDDDKESD